MVPGRSSQRIRAHSNQAETAPSSVSVGSPYNAHGPPPAGASLISRSAADASDLASYFPPPNVEEFGFGEGEVWDASGDALFSSELAAGNADTHTSEHIRSPSLNQPHLYQDPYTYGHIPPSTAGQGLPPNSPPHVPTVAPLNLGTSLHRTLLSLRESIVTLSTAVDSLARRQDVALATEAMRMNEEIRSLRVVIHGLRMQVSDALPISRSPPRSRWG